MGKFFSRVWQSAVVASMLVSPAIWAKVTIYMCGDSTMQDWNAGYYPKQGIGQDFQYWFDSGLATVKNYGAGGTAAETYYTGGKWDPVKNGLQKGDYVFIQFGINDRNYSNEANYVTYMTKMVQEAQAKGAYPILMNPVRRSDFRNKSAVNDSIYESYHNYPILTRKLAQDLNVPIIDMDTLSRNLLLSLGKEYTLNFLNVWLDAGEYSNYKNGNSDNLHFQQNGANSFGRIITEQLRVHPDPIVKKLADYLSPMYKVDVKVSPAGADSLTSISNYYPKGMTVTLKSRPYANGKKLLGWYDGNGNKVTANSNSTVESSNIITFVMGDKSTQYTAVYESGSAEKYTGNGTALTTFPTCTPKKLGDSCPGASTPVSSSSIEIVIPESSSSEEVAYISTDMKNFIDASNPEEGDGLTESNHEGFMGEGFFNFTNAINSYATYDMVFPSAGYVTMGIRYAFDGSADRKVNVYLGDHDYYVNCKPTGGWDVWDTAYVDLDLINGEAPLKIISLTENGGPNIDAFAFSIEGVRRKADVAGNPAANPGNITDLRTHKLSDISVKKDYFMVSVYSVAGRLVAQQAVAGASLKMSLDGMVQKEGMYHVVVRSAGQVRHFNWVKIR